MSTPAPSTPEGAATPDSTAPRRPGLSAADSSMQRLQNVPGYSTPVFKGKDAQRAQVEKIVGQGGFVPPPLVKSEVAWFYDHLGIDDTYFTAETAEGVADHVLALYGAKVLAFTKHDPSALFIELEKINPDGSGATFIHNSKPGVTATTGPGATCEKRYARFALVPSLFDFFFSSWCGD